MMNFVLKMMNFVLKMMYSVLKTMNFVSKTTRPAMDSWGGFCAALLGLRVRRGAIYSLKHMEFLISTEEMSMLQLEPAARRAGRDFSSQWFDGHLGKRACADAHWR